MQRVRLCATIVALLSIVSFSARALVSGSAATHDSSISRPAAEAKPALGPDGRQVRVISFSLGDRVDDAGGAAAQPRPEVLQPEPSAPTPVMAVGARTAGATPAEAKAEPTAPAARAHRAPKRLAATPTRTRDALARSQKLFIVCGLF
jgi:hypothetical protein